jgi:hypothetical protein
LACRPPNAAGIEDSIRWTSYLMMPVVARGRILPQIWAKDKRGCLAMDK